MWELDFKESWAPKNWCFWTVVLEKTLESPMDCKEIQPVNPKGNQSWIFIGRTKAEAETPILWPPDAKNWLSGKDPDAGKDWSQEETGMTEDEMVGWHHRLDGHEFEQALGVGDGLGDLACYRPWGHKESDTTEQLNWTVSLTGLSQWLVSLKSQWRWYLGLLWPPSQRNSLLDTVFQSLATRVDEGHAAPFKAYPSKPPQGNPNWYNFSESS